MEIFRTTLQDQPKDKVFTLPVKKVDIPVPKKTENKDRAIYPHVTSFTKEEVDAHIDSGIVGPLIRSAEAKNDEKKVEVVTEILETQPDMDDAVAQLELEMQNNPVLKGFISPATLAALKQSDNLLARRVAQTKLANVAIAVEVLEAKAAQNRETTVAERLLVPFGGRYGAGDFFDYFVSDLPILNVVNTSSRKDLANRFVSILDSNEDPSVVKAELQNIVNEAADQGLFTQDNRFFFQDFMVLVAEGTTGSAAATQEAFDALGTLAGIAGALGDAARLLSFAKKGKDPILATLKDAAKADDPVNGHSTVVDFAEGVQRSSIITPPAVRTPDEAAAWLDLNLETKAMEDAINIRLAAGQSIDDDAFEAFKAKAIKKAKEDAEKSGQKRYIDTVIDVDFLENVYLDNFYGTLKQRPYTSEKAAKAAAEAIGFGAEVVPAKDGGFLVRQRRNLPSGMFTSGKSPEEIFKELSWYRTSDTDEMGYGFLTKYLWSPLSQTTDNLNAIMKQGESARAMASMIFDKDYNTLLKSVGSKGIKAVDNVFRDIRDGSRAYLRADPSVGEFEQIFFELNKRLPTEPEKTLYLKTVERNQVDYILSADVLFKREVAKGIEMYRVNEIEVKGLVADKGMFSEALAWFEDAGKYVKVSELPDDVTLIRLSEPQKFGEKTHDLVASRTPRKRALTHTDVLGYNPGGSRLYEENITNFFIKQDQTVDLADGRVATGRPTTVMGVKTQKEAEKAVGKINEIIEAIPKFLGKKFNPMNYTKEQYRSIVLSLGSDGSSAAIKNLEKALGKKIETRLTKAQRSELNELIASLSDWNPNVHSVKTLVEFFEDMNLDLRKTVGYSEDGKPLVDGDTFVGDLTFREVMSAPGTLKVGNVRRDKVMIGYGGQPLPVVPPMESIQRSVMSSVMRSTNTAYEAASIQGLIKGLIVGSGTVANPKPLVAGKTLDEIARLPLRQKLRQLDGKIFTGTVQGKKLELERQKILFRLESQNYLDAGYAKLKDRLANFLYDKEWKKTAGFIDARSAEPFAAVRGIVFDVYLGMFNPAQLWVQASQIPNIIAMSEGLNGVRAVAAMPIVRKLVQNGHKAPTEEASKWIATTIGLTPKQFIDVVEELKKNGRVHVAASMADLGEDSSGKIMMRKFREKGRVFYNEAELAARITAHLSAALEYIKKNGFDADLSSNKARKYIAHKADQFTNAMTSMSRTGVEQLPGAQFMSYQFRMLEALFGGVMPGTKKFLTWKQRAKLATMQLGLYGMAGLPLVGAQLDWYNFNYGLGLDEQTYEVIRNGALDAILEYMTGIETEVGRRLAWGEGFYNTFEDKSVSPIGQLLLGPSYTLGKDIITSFSRHRFSIETGNFGSIPHDIMQTARSIKTVNMVYNAYMAWKTERYYNKREEEIISGLTNREAVAILFDVNLEKINEFWRDGNFLFKKGEYYRSQANKINQLNYRLNDLIESKGWDHPDTIAVMNELEFIYAIENMTPYDLREIERYLDKNALNAQEEQVIRIQRSGLGRTEGIME